MYTVIYTDLYKTLCPELKHMTEPTYSIKNLHSFVLYNFPKPISYTSLNNIMYTILHTIVYTVSTL